MLADIHLTDVEGVSPVVVGDTPVITTDGAEPPGNKEYRQPPEHRAVQSQWRLQVPA